MGAGQLVSNDGAFGFADQGHPPFLDDQGGYEFILTVVVEITHCKVLDVSGKPAGLPAWAQPHTIPGEACDLRFSEIPHLIQGGAGQIVILDGNDLAFLFDLVVPHHQPQGKIPFVHNLSPIVPGDAGIQHAAAETFPIVPERFSRGIDDLDSIF